MATAVEGACTLLAQGQAGSWEWTQSLPHGKPEKQLWVCDDSSLAMEGLRPTPLPAHLPQVPEEVVEMLAYRQWWQQLWVESR